MVGRKPQILKEGEYTITKLIERLGGCKPVWKKYFLLEKFSSKIEILEHKSRLFKFKMLVSEEEMKKIFKEEKRLNQNKGLINAKIMSGSLPLRKENKNNNLT